MAYYRLYFMNPRTGRIQRFEEFDAPSDAQAIDRCQRHRAAAPFELWSGAKKIYRLDPLPQSGSDWLLPSAGNGLAA
ncbi:MAG: hypothetical protein M3177_07835 [Pseudomonadota bacterium]|nr:hypothetical protein [Pseudomonadota bacterium]